MQKKQHNTKDITNSNKDTNPNSPNKISSHILFHEIEHHLMVDASPSKYLRSLQKLPEMSTYPFTLLSSLRSTKQSPQYHPEGSVWNHTLMVVDEAAKVKNKSTHPEAFMWSALLHDIGKPTTTKVRKGKITSYNHDQVGAKLAKKFLLEFVQDETLISHVFNLVLYHMQILYVLKNLQFADLEGIKSSGNINDIALLGLCDRLGRANSNRKLEQDNIQLFLEKCNT